METPAEFAEYWMRHRGGWVKFFEILGTGFVMVGIGMAIWQFYDKLGQLAVPLLLAGIACMLILLVAYAEGIVADFDYLIKMLREGKDTQQNDPERLPIANK